MPLCNSIQESERPLSGMHLAEQMYPGQTKFMVEAYANATSQPLSYLIIDLKPNCPDELRLRTNILVKLHMHTYLNKTRL